MSARLVGEFSKNVFIFSKSYHTSFSFQMFPESSQYIKKLFVIHQMVGKESLAKTHCQEFIELIFLQHSNKKTGSIALDFCPEINWFQTWSPFIQ